MDNDKLLESKLVGIMGEDKIRTSEWVEKDPLSAETLKHFYKWSDRKRRVRGDDRFTKERQNLP